MAIHLIVRIEVVAKMAPSLPFHPPLCVNVINSPLPPFPCSLPEQCPGSPLGFVGLGILQCLFGNFCPFRSRFSSLASRIFAAIRSSSSKCRAGIDWIALLGFNTRPWQWRWSWGGCINWQFPNAHFLQGLPDPADSIFWADELMGNGNGYVKTGRTMGGGKDGIGDLCRLQIY